MFGFCQSHSMSVSVSGSHPGHHSTLTCQVSLGSPWLGQFLSLSLLLMTLTVFRGTGQIFCRMCPYWNLSDAFLTIRLGIWVWGRMRRWSSISITSCQGGTLWQIFSRYVCFIYTSWRITRNGIFWGIDYFLKLGFLMNLTKLLPRGSTNFHTHQKWIHCNVFPWILTRIPFIFPPVCGAHIALECCNWWLMDSP